MTTKRARSLRNSANRSYDASTASRLRGSRRSRPPSTRARGARAPPQLAPAQSGHDSRSLTDGTTQRGSECVADGRSTGGSVGRRARGGGVLPRSPHGCARSRPEEPSEDLVASVRKYGGRVPLVAAAFGIEPTGASLATAPRKGAPRKAVPPPPPVAEAPVPDAPVADAPPADARWPSRSRRTRRWPSRSRRTRPWRSRSRRQPEAAPEAGRARRRYAPDGRARRRPALSGR